MTNIGEKIATIIRNTPFHPYWLEWRRMEQANYVVLDKYLAGDVLEVGCGDGQRSAWIKKTWPAKIKRYIASDYPGWKKVFSEREQMIDRYGRFWRGILNLSAWQEPDTELDALNLKVKDSSFDTHLSFETIEHVPDCRQYFREAARVIRPGGHIITSSPFMFRLHGEEPEQTYDYARYTYGYFKVIAKENNLKLKCIYSNTGIGAAVALLTNQFLLLKLRQWPLLAKIILLPFALIYMTLIQIVAVIVDIKPDFRFAIHYHVVFEKK